MADEGMSGGTLLPETVQDGNPGAGPAASAAHYPPQLRAPIADERQPTLGEVFSNPNFFKLWIGQVVAYLGDRIVQMALLSLLAATAASVDEQASRASMITISATIPYILLSPFIGGLIDRLDRRTLLVLMDLARAIVILGVAFLLNAKAHPSVAYGVVFLVACATSVFAPTKSAFMPEIVTREQLLRANSVTSTMGSLMTLVGTPIGTMIVLFGNRMNIQALPGYRIALFVNAATYLFSMMMLLAIVRPKSAMAVERAREAEVHGEGNYFKVLWDGLRFIRRNRIPGCAVALESTFYTFGGALFACLYRVVYTRLAPSAHAASAAAEADIANKYLSWIFGALGVGLFLGCVFAGRVAARIRLGRVVAVCFWSTALFILLLRAPFGLWGTCATIFMIAFSGGGVIVSNETALQRSVPDEMRGRVFAVNSFLLNLLMVISIGLTNAAMDHHLLSLGGMLTVIAVLTATAGVIAILIFPRDISISVLRAEQAVPVS